MKKELVEQAQIYVKQLFENEYSGHDYFHTLRVFKMATYIANREQADLRIVQLASLLHDVDDRKLFPETYLDQRNAKTFLLENGVDKAMIDTICQIIRETSYMGTDSVVSETFEGKCVQDADRLDAIGAIGIARAFAYGGSHGRLIHHPDIMPNMDMGANEYISCQSTSINHFHEKLFRLAGLMNTPTAKEIAIQRENYMREYIAEFMAEWKGIR